MTRFETKFSAKVAGIWGGGSFLKAVEDREKNARENLLREKLAVKFTLGGVRRSGAL